MKHLLTIILALVVIVVFVQVPGCKNSDSHKIDTSEDRKNTPLSEVVDMAVTIENPSLGNQGRVESRFDYLFSRLSFLCGGTPMQHGSAAAALWRRAADRGIDDSYMDFIEQYHRVVVRTGVHNSGQPNKEEACRELMSAYHVLRINDGGRNSDEAADDLIYLVNYIGWDKWDILMKELQR